MSKAMERVFWEIRRAFYSFRSSPVFVLLLLQVSGLLLLYAKGAGELYLNMLGVLILISLASWLLTSAAHGNRAVLIYALLLLTVGTMLQCILKQEQIVKNPEKYTAKSAVGQLQFQYLLAFAAAVACAVLYRKRREIASAKVCRLLCYGMIAVSLGTLLLAKGVGAGNVKNWISVGGLSIQTTEFIKLFYVFIGAGLLGRTEDPPKGNRRAFCLLTFVEAAFLGAQGEFGTLLLLLLVFLAFLFLFVPDWKVFARAVLVLAALAGAAVLLGMWLIRLSESGSVIAENPLGQFILSNVQKIANRFIYWKNPEKDALGFGYQLIKARESILLGGWFGTSSVTDLPVKTSDLVYPALIQRCGMVFALLVFLIFLLLWLEGVKLFVRKEDGYHRAVAAGFVTMLMVQTLLIIGGSTGLCPLTGITLPFISSGGSSLLVCFSMVGILIAVSGNVKWKGAVEDGEEAEVFTEGTMPARCRAHLRHLYVRCAGKKLRPDTGRVQGGGRAKRRSQSGDL